MLNTRWARVALLALALPACATAAGTTHSQTAMISQPAGQAAQPGSWNHPDANKQVNYVEHAGARGQAAQPYAWLDSRPAYPVAQPGLAQDGMSHPGGRAAQNASWTPAPKSSWTLASTQGSKARQ